MQFSISAHASIIRISAYCLSSFLAVCTVPSARAELVPIAELYRQGAYPHAHAVLGSDGNFYGTTTARGKFDLGTIYRLSPTGTLTTLADLTADIGTSPATPLVEGADGSWYGTMSYGGDFGLGTVYKLTPSGELALVYSFRNEDQVANATALVMGFDGALYGVCGANGVSGYGTLFRVTTQGEFTRLVAFDYSNVGVDPIPYLTVAPDGTLYGGVTQSASGTQSSLYTYSPGGQLNVLMDFSSGQLPSSPLTLGTDGYFYGTTVGDTSSQTPTGGMVYKASPSGNYVDLANFKYPAGLSNTGNSPVGQLALGADGNFYGIDTARTSRLAGYTTELYRVTPAGVLSKFKEFDDAKQPVPGVLVGTDNALYGSFSSSGLAASGEMYRVTLDGNAETFANFGLCPGGCGINQVPTVGADGIAYGVTPSGGQFEAGTLYKIQNNVVTVISSFRPQQVIQPSALTLGPDGNFYGASMHGGKNDAGTVFRITPKGKITVLAELGSTDGTFPEAAPVFGPDGALYGSTFTGSPNFAGIIYKLSNPTAKSTTSMRLTTLFNLSTSTTGGEINSPLTLASDGNFYGYTTTGGPQTWGTIFRITPTGTFTMLGSNPFGHVTLSPFKIGPDGALYGLSSGGGSNSAGAIFRIGLDGSIQTLFSFDDITTGGHPSGDFVLGADGIIYGTTTFGGNGSGEVFQYDLANQSFAVLDFYTDTSNPTLIGLLRDGSGSFYASALGIHEEPIGRGEGAIYRWIPPTNNAAVKPARTTQHASNR